MFTSQVNTVVNYALVIVLILTVFLVLPGCELENRHVNTSEGLPATSPYAFTAEEEVKKAGNITSIYRMENSEIVCYAGANYDRLICHWKSQPTAVK